MNAPSYLGYFKSDDDGTWYGHTIGRNLYKLTKLFDDVISCCHQNATAIKVEGFRGFLLNISKTVKLIFTKLMSCLGNHL